MLGYMWIWSSGKEDTRMSCKLIELVTVEIRAVVNCAEMLHGCEYKVK